MIELISMIYKDCIQVGKRPRPRPGRVLAKYGYREFAKSELHISLSFHWQVAETALDGVVSACLSEN